VATSLRDLLAEMITIARTSASSQTTADDAVVALGRLSRPLTKLSYEGLHERSGTQRDLAVRRLGLACEQAGAAWRGIQGGRLADLAGVSADVVGIVVPETSPAERWATALRIGTVTRHLVDAVTAHPPYSGVPELDIVREATHAVRRLGATDPTAWRPGHVVLDRSIPLPHSETATGLDLATASAIALADLLRRHVRANGPGLSVSQALITMRACEAVATRLAEAAAANGTNTSEWRAAASGWRTAWTALRGFRDGAPADTRPGGDLELVRHAATLAAGASRPGPPADPTEAGLDAAARRQTQILANQLPRIADQLELGVRRWGATGQVCAHANALPFREEQATSWFRGEVITLRPRDLEPAVGSIRRAGLLSATVAVSLDATTRPGEQRPQPHLTASYAMRASLAGPELVTRSLPAPTFVADPRHRTMHRAGPRP
jgi:hypothetical protein